MNPYHTLYHPRADECPHESVGKACFVCQEQWGEVLDPETPKRLRAMPRIGNAFTVEQFKQTRYAMAKSQLAYRGYEFIGGSNGFNGLWVDPHTGRWVTDTEARDKGWIPMQES